MRSGIARGRAGCTFSLLMSLLGFVAGSCAEPHQAELEKIAKPSEEAQDRIPAVEVLTLRREDLTRTISLTGSIEAVEKASLYAKVAGYLREISVDIGDRVKKGQTLAVLDIPEMAMEYAQAEAELAEVEAHRSRAQADYQLQEVIFERSKTLREREAITQQEFDEAQARYAVAAAGVQLARARIDNVQAHLGKFRVLMQYAKIKAPFDGIITDRFVDPGALIQMATSANNVSPVVIVQRMDTVRVFVDVPEPDVPAVNRGDPATLVLSAMPDVKFEGEVTRFAAALDPSTRTMKTEIDLPNSQGLLRPGMYGNVTLVLESHPAALTLPAATLVTEQGQHFVFVLKDNKAHKVRVTTGIDDGIRVEILSGLQGNEAIIVAGTSMLTDGGPVRAVSADAAGRHQAGAK